MRKKIGLLAAFLPLWIGAQPVMLSLEKAIEIGLSENPTIQIADIEIERKKYTKQEISGGLFPTIAAGADITQTIEKQVMFVDFPGVPSNPDGIKVGRNNTWAVGFNAQLPLIAPQLWKNIQLSKADIANAVEAARASRLNLVNQIKQAYYQILITQDSYLVLQKSYQNAKTNAEDFRNKFRVGVASEYDVLRAEVQVRNQEPGLLQAENSVLLAKLQLKVLIGIDIAQEIGTSEELSGYEKSMFAQAINNTAQALDNNPNLRKLELQVNYAKKAVEVQKMAYMPTLAASALYNWISNNNDYRVGDYRWSPFSTVGISLKVPIFAGGARYNKVRQAKAGVTQLELQRIDLERSLATQLQMAQDKINKSIKQITSNSEGVRQAEKAYDIMSKRFDIGAGTFIEINDADLALTNARLSYYQAIYDYLVAQADLELILGKEKTTEQK